MILLIDNYDSFTYNLVHYLSEVSEEKVPVQVYRNDTLNVDEVRRLKPSHIVLSPGPCTPDEAGICVELVRSLHQEVPILGVCLGHQAIGQALGGKVIRAKQAVHGKVHEIFHDGQSIFAACPNPFPATRYHSLIVERESLPSCLEILAWTADGEIMALRHREATTLIGVQFHPESILTTEGKSLLSAFLNLRRNYASSDRTTLGRT